MPMGDFFGALRRRWIVVLVGILLTVGLSGAAYWFFKPTYEITGTVLLLPPASSATTGSPNPYLQLGGLNQAVDLVGLSLTDQATTLEMQGISKTVDFTVKADVRTNSPLLVVDVKDSSPETALRIRDMLVARVPVRLDALQQSLGVSSKDRVTSSVLTLDTEAVEVGRNRLRAAVVAGVLGLGLTLAVAALWDARALRQGRRRARRRVRAKKQAEAFKESSEASRSDEAMTASTEVATLPKEDVTTEDVPAAEPGPPDEARSELTKTVDEPIEDVTAGEDITQPTEATDAEAEDIDVGPPASPARDLETVEEGADAPDAPR